MRILGIGPKAKDAPVLMDANSGQMPQGQKVNWFVKERSLFGKTFSFDSLLLEAVDGAEKIANKVNNVVTRKFEHRIKNNELGSKGYEYNSNGVKVQKEKVMKLDNTRTWGLAPLNGFEV